MRRSAAIKQDVADTVSGFLKNCRQSIREACATSRAMAMNGPGADMEEVAIGDRGSGSGVTQKGFQYCPKWRGGASWRAAKRFQLTRSRRAGHRRPRGTISNAHYRPERQIVSVGRQRSADRDLGAWRVAWLDRTTCPLAGIRRQGPLSLGAERRPAALYGRENAYSLINGFTRCRGWLRSASPCVMRFFTAACCRPIRVARQSRTRMEPIRWARNRSADEGRGADLTRFGRRHREAACDPRRRKVDAAAVRRSPGRAAWSRTAPRRCCASTRQVHCRRARRLANASAEAWRRGVYFDRTSL